MPCRDFPEAISRKLIEVSVEPDLTKLKPIVIIRQDELVKLLTQIEGMKKPWLAMKYNDAIYIIWNRLLCVFDSR
jgi:hypothetical protein